MRPLAQLKSQLVATKRQVAAPLLVPVVGLKRTALGLARGALDTKERLLDTVARMLGR